MTSRKLPTFDQLASCSVPGCKCAEEDAKSGKWRTFRHVGEESVRMEKDLWFGDDKARMKNNRAKLRLFLEDTFRRDADAARIIPRLLKSKANEQAEVCHSNKKKVEHM